MRNYLFVLIMAVIIGSVIFAWKSCNPGLPNINNPISGTFKPKPGKPHTVTNTTTTTIKPSGETVTVVEHSVSNPPKMNRIKVGARFELDKYKNPTYSLGYERRVFDSLWLGVSGYMDKAVGVSLGVEF